jgi:hypothetical protein
MAENVVSLARSPAPWEFVIRDILTFAALNGDTRVAANRPCSLCTMRPASIYYEIRCDEDASQKLTGICCSTCAANFIKIMEERQFAFTALDA